MKDKPFELIAPSSSQSDISDHFRKLDEGLTQLAQVLRSIESSCAFVTKLPDAIKGQEDSPVSRITGETVHAHDAIEEAIRSFQDLYIKKGLSQKIARRRVGVIWIQPHNTPNDQLQKLLNCVDNINQHKVSLRQKITALPSRQARFKALREVRSSIMTVHLYRTIKCFMSEDIRNLGFSWERKQLLSKLDLKGKQQLIERIEAEALNRDEIAGLPLKQLIESIGPVPPEQLRLRRDVRVQPVANLMRNTTQTVTAVMPIIILQNQPLTSTPIKDFDARVRRKKRSDRVETEILGTFNGSQIERRYY
ncbi:DNA replication terminus site-binding protein [Gilvimarinus chinensis]|uniref:DNA replication terminus site-binding protein n=1 Tax=Gilvimarinus chinensis TaxID=396005 RepID=UPI0003702A05|nr:DNA replication terminus site-binding protein [Gilvimarinus chinensis]